MRKAVFLDRDNTLIYDEGYIHEAEKVVLLDGVVEGLKLLREAGYLLIVISNQSGIGRGYYTEKEFWEVNEKIQELLKPYGLKIDDFFFCPHRPDEGCRCRKPETLLVELAAKKWNVNLEESYTIGDKESDVYLGVKAGCRGGIMVGTPPFKTLLDAARFIVKG